MDTAQSCCGWRFSRADGGLTLSGGSWCGSACDLCGYQLIGQEFPDAGRALREVGILDIRTDRPEASRANPPTRPDPQALKPGLTDLLTGYENHAGATHLGLMPDLWRRLNLASAMVMSRRAQSAAM